MRLRRSTTIALAALLPAMMGGSGGGCSSSSSNSGTSDGAAAGGNAGGQSHQQAAAPASAPGKCETQHGALRSGGSIVAALNWTCSGSAQLTVFFYLQTEHTKGKGDYVTLKSYSETSPAGLDPTAVPQAVNSAFNVQPATITVPCVPGWYKTKVVGQEMGVGATIPINTSSSPVDITC